MLWVLLAAAANAQEPAEPQGGEPTFTFDSLMVPTFQAVDPTHQHEADRLRVALLEILASSHTVLPFDDVPGNWTEEYGPDLYMRACPPGQYGGCTLVLAQRALADWGVGATLAQNVDDPEAPHLVLTMYLVDVGQARDVAVFPVPLKEEEGAVLSSIGQVVDLLVEGAFDTQDLRDREQADLEAIEAARKQVMAAYLGQLELELGQPESPVLEAAPPELITLDEVAQKAEEEEVPAWVRAGLSQRAYVRYLNSGKELSVWKESTRGRAGALIVRATGGIGEGPWHQRYAGATLRSGYDLQPIHIVQVLEATRGGTQVGELEVGLGVLPYLDVTFVGGLHTGDAEISRQEEVEGGVPLLGDPEMQGIQTSHWGLRVTGAPFPRAMVRPTVTAGVSWWQGASIDAGTPYTPLRGPQRWLLQVLPGVEVDTPGRVLGLFARVGPEFPVAGSSGIRTESGSGLSEPPAATSDGGPGWIVHVGLQLRVAPRRQ